ncbi:MAG: hypothetical protein ABTQ32_22500 [Myxococcaceae bacterium]
MEFKIAKERELEAWSDVTLDDIEESAWTAEFAASAGEIDIPRDLSDITGWPKSTDSNIAA